MSRVLYVTLEVSVKHDELPAHNDPDELAEELFDRIHLGQEFLDPEEDPKWLRSIDSSRGAWEED